MRNRPSAPKKSATSYESHQDPLKADYQGRARKNIIRSIPPLAVDP